MLSLCLVMTKPCLQADSIITWYFIMLTLCWRWNLCCFPSSSTMLSIKGNEHTSWLVWSVCHVIVHNTMACDVEGLSNGISLIFKISSFYVHLYMIFVILYKNSKPQSQEVVCYLDNFKLCVYEMTFSLGSVKSIILTMFTTNALKYNFIELLDK